MFKANIEEKNDHLLVKLIGDLDVYSKEDFSKFCDESLKKYWYRFYNRPWKIGLYRFNRSWYVYKYIQRPKRKR